MSTHVLPMARPRLRRLHSDFILSLGDFEIILDDSQIDELVGQLRALGTVEDGPECECGCEWCSECEIYGGAA